MAEGGVRAWGGDPHVLPCLRRVLPATFNWPKIGSIRLAAEAEGLTGSPASQEENVQKDDVP